MISLPEITYYLTVYGFFLVLIFGMIGNLLNIIIFRTRHFRTNAPVFYLMMSAIFSEITLVIGIAMRFITEYFGNNLVNTNRYVCKIRGYLLFSVPCLSTMCVFLSSFDQCISTSSNIRWRRLSSVSIAQRISAVTLLFIMISSSFCLFVYDIFNGICTPSPGLGATMVNVYICTFVIPVAIIGLSIFGIKTWLHLRRSRNRITSIPQSLTHPAKNQQINHQLVIFTLAQGLASIISHSIRLTAFVYAVTTATQPKSVDRKQIEYLFQQISLLIFYAHYGIGFYLNYACSKAFRKSFHDFKHNLLSKCLQSCVQMVN